MKIGDRHPTNVATGDLKVGRLAKVEIEAKAEMETVRIEVLAPELPTEVDHHRVASQATVDPKGVAGMRVTTAVPDGVPTGVSRATVDQMIEVPMHVAPVTVVQKAGVRMVQVRVTVDRKDAAPMHAGPMMVVRTGVAVRIEVLALELPTEVDHHRVASQVIVDPMGVGGMRMTTVVPDGVPTGASRATVDQMIETLKHVALVTVVQKAEVRMGRVRVTVDRKDAAPMHAGPVMVVRTEVAPIIAVLADLEANILDGPVTDHTVIAGRMVIIVTAENTDGQAVPNLAIVGPIIEAASPLIEAQADQTLVIETEAITDLGITSSDVAKDVDRVAANSLIVVLKAEDLLAVTAITTDSGIDGLNIRHRAVQAAATLDIMADRANTISHIKVIVAPTGAGLLTMTATIGDLVAEGSNTTEIMAQAEVISGIMVARADTSSLIMMVVAPVDHNSHIAMAGMIGVAARNTMLGFLIRDKVLMQNIMNPDGMVQITRGRALIGRPWMADRQAMVQADQTSVVVAVPVAPDLAARVLVVLVSADILHHLKCSKQPTPTRTAS